jgi:pimeloyl-ACP methyl ester carboxylesterase
MTRRRIPAKSSVTPAHASRTLAAQLQPPRWLKVTFAALERVAPRGGGVLAASLFTTPRRHRTPEWEQALRATARTQRVAGDLHLWEWGPTSGAPILLLHGWEGRGTQLGKLAEPFIAAGHRVIAMDGPAHGRSGGKRAHPIAFAEALLAVQGAIGTFRGVIAHSMGAASTGIALHRGLRVERVALLGGPASLPEVLNRFTAMIGIEPRVARHMRERLAEITGAHPDEVDIRVTGATFTVPALIIHDRHDAEVPVADGRIIADHWPKATYLEVDVGGHRRMLKAPEVIEAVRSFMLAGR